MKLFLFLMDVKKQIFTTLQLNHDNSLGNLNHIVEREMNSSHELARKHREEEEEGAEVEAESEECHFMKPLDLHLHPHSLLSSSLPFSLSVSLFSISISPPKKKKKWRFHFRFTVYHILHAFHTHLTDFIAFMIVLHSSQTFNFRPH